MELSGAYTWRDSYRIFLLGARPRFAWGVVGILLIATAAVMLVIAWRDYLASMDGVPSPFGLTLSVLFLILLFGAYYPWSHYKAFRRSKLLSLPVTLTLTDQAVTISNQHLSAKYPWELIVAARENRHLFVLYDAAGPLVAIPKHFAPNAETLAQVRSVLQSKGLVV